MSKREPELNAGEIKVAVQAAMEICGTCSHDKENRHPDGGPCTAEWETTDECIEYWPTRWQFEDDKRVIRHATKFGGGVELELNRRVTTEWFEGLRIGRRLHIRVEAVVTAKGFSPVIEKGVMIGLQENRKIDIDRITLVSNDGEVFDA